MTREEAKRNAWHAWHANTPSDLIPMPPTLWGTAFDAGWDAARKAAQIAGDQPTNDGKQAILPGDNDAIDD